MPAPVLPPEFPHPPPRPTPALLGLAKSEEGLRLTSYWDNLGKVWTIGWGSTGPDIVEGLTWTMDECEARFDDAMEIVMQQVYNMLQFPTEVNQNQYDALCDFAYNEGLGHLRNSTLLKMVNAGDFANAAQQFKRWDYAGGVVVDGLLDRRLAEAALFCKED